MSEVCWHCLRCHWYCDDVLEECRGQSEPCHEFKLCMEDIEKMQNKFEDRLVNVNDVIEAVDKHTREDETLDEDISVILEEVKTAFDKEKVIEELKSWEKASHDAGIQSTYAELDNKASGYYQESRAYHRAIKIVEKVEIEIPDDRWFRGEWDFRPQDKQLCVAIHKYGGNTPWIYQYRKADWLHPKKDYFLDVSEKWNLDSLGIDEWNPSFLEWWGVDRWKPLGLPEDVNKRILAEIEKWFEEDE